MKHLEAFQLPSLQFWLVSQIVQAVLEFGQRVSMNSRVANRSQATVPVTLLLFRPSESAFAFLSSLIMLAPTFRRLAHLRPQLQLAFRDESATVGLI